jgi:hypothetical protein
MIWVIDILTKNAMELARGEFSNISLDNSDMTMPIIIDIRVNPKNGRGFLNRI